MNKSVLILCVVLVSVAVLVCAERPAGKRGKPERKPTESPAGDVTDSSIEKHDDHPEKQHKRDVDNDNSKEHVDSSAEGKKVKAKKGGPRKNANSASN